MGKPARCCPAKASSTASTLLQMLPCKGPINHIYLASVTSSSFLPPLKDALGTLRLRSKGQFSEDFPGSHGLKTVSVLVALGLNREFPGSHPEGCTCVTLPCREPGEAGAIPGLLVVK